MVEEFKNDHDAIVTLVAEFRGFQVQNSRDIQEIKDSVKDLKDNLASRVNLLERNMQTKMAKVEFGTFLAGEHTKLLVKLDKLNDWKNLIMGGLILLNTILGLLAIYYSSRH